MAEGENAPTKTGIMSSMTKKLGPLPVWTWGLIGGAVVIFFISRNKASGAPNTVTQPLGAPGLVGDGGGGGGGGSGGGSTIVSTPPPPPVVTQGPNPPGGPAPVGQAPLIGVMLGGQLLNWSQESITNFLNQVANTPNFPWQFAGISNGVYQFVPISTRQPLPVPSPSSTPTPTNGGDVGVAQLAGATGGGLNDSYAVTLGRGLRNNGFFPMVTYPSAGAPGASINPHQVIRPHEPTMVTMRTPGVSVNQPTYGISGVRTPQAQSRAEAHGNELSRTVAPVRVA